MNPQKYEQVLMLESIGNFSMRAGQAFDVDEAHYRLLRVMSGMCKILLHNQEVFSISGVMVLLLCGRCSYHVTSATEGCVAMMLTFSCVPCTGADNYSLNAMADSYPHFRRFLQKGASCAFFRDETAITLSQMHTINSAMRNTTSDGGDIVPDLLCSLLLCATLLAARENQFPAANRHIRAACRYIQDHYALPVTAQKIADYAGIHVSHLHRIFYKDKGVHINEYLMQTRLKSAANMLSNTDIPLQLIAERTGFSTQQYFTRVFRKNMGITPLNYRKTYGLTCDYQNYEKHIAQEVSE